MKLLLAVSLLALSFAAAPLIQAQPKIHEGVGVVKKVDREAGRVTLAHEPIKSLDWPGMTMPFAVQDKALLDKVKPEQKVKFEFVQQGTKPVITSIK